MKDILQQHFDDRRRCLNCGCYRNWREMPVCPCGWSRGKDWTFPRQPKEELPPTSALSGMDPHFTGDLSTEAYIRSLRGG